MPKKDFFLKTDYKSFPSVLVLDEQGEAASHLVDALLARGFLVYYWGTIIKEDFSYLMGKNNFVFLDSFTATENLLDINYFFYFPNESFSVWPKALALLRKVNLRISVCCPNNFLENEKIKEIIEGNGRIIAYDCLFGPRIKKDFLGKIFFQIVNTGTVLIEEEENREICPIYIGDLINELLKLSFSPFPTTREKIFLLETKRVTLGSFVKTIEEVFPAGKINFSLSKTNIQSQKGILERDNKVFIDLDIAEKTEETTSWFLRNQEKQPRESRNNQEQPPKEEMSKNKEESEEKLDFLFPVDEQSPKKENHRFISKTSKKILFGFFTFFLLLFLFFGFPLILIGLTGTLGLRAMLSAEKMFFQGDFILAAKKSEQADKLFKLSQGTMFLTNPFYSLIGFTKQIETVNNTLTVVQNIDHSLGFSSKATEELGKLINSFFRGDGVAWDEKTGTIKADYSFAYQESSLAQSIIEKSKTGFEFVGRGADFKRLKDFLPQARENLLKVQKLVGVLPKILAQKERKTYLLIFQDNLELRPTGGFISAYAVVNLENGKLADFSVYDIYRADNLLKGHVEPPAKIKELLGENEWYFRDSNWEPDFPSSAKRALWFLDKETQISADGAIAINLEVFKRIVPLFGEITVEGFPEKINEDNLFKMAAANVENLGSTGNQGIKNDFIGALAKAVFEKMKNANNKETLALIKAFWQALVQKEITVYFNDQELEATMVDLGWEGGVRGYRSLDSNTTFVDSLLVSEANVGINKVNLFTQRKISHQVSYNGQGRTEEKLIITYENKSVSESWPGGGYKNYVRVYLPKETELFSVFENTPEQPGAWFPFNSKLISVSEEYGKKVIGFYTEIAGGSQKKVEINYQVSQVLQTSSAVQSYLLLIQKQSGIYPTSYELIFSYPVGFVPLRVLPGAEVKGQKLLIAEEFKKDIIFQIDLAH